MKIVNITQHNATPEQVAEGVIDVKEVKKIKELLTFVNLPSLEEMVKRSTEIKKLVVLTEHPFDGVMLGGAPFFMRILEEEFSNTKIFYAFSVRESIEKEIDGKIVKNSIFKHQGLIHVNPNCPNHVEGKLSVDLSSIDENGIDDWKPVSSQSNNIPLFTPYGDRDRNTDYKKVKVPLNEFVEQKLQEFNKIFSARIQSRANIFLKNKKIFNFCSKFNLVPSENGGTADGFEFVISDSLNRRFISHEIWEDIENNKKYQFPFSQETIIEGELVEFDPKYKE